MFLIFLAGLERGIRGRCSACAHEKKYKVSTIALAALLADRRAASTLARLTCICVRGMGGIY